MATKDIRVAVKAKKPADQTAIEGSSEPDPPPSSPGAV